MTPNIQETEPMSLRPMLRAAVLASLCLAFPSLAVSAAATAGAPGGQKAAIPEVQGGYLIHRAVEGDTLVKLASRYLQKRNNWQPLQKLNQIEDPTRIRPGTLIRIPVPDIRREAADLKVIASQGDVQVEGGRLSTGTAVKEGQQINTGDNGFVTVQLADGSTLTVQSKSRVKVDSARQLVNTGGVLDSVFRVVSGRVEAGVERQRGPAARFEVRTDTSTMGVRGTRFRVSAETGGKVARSEVVEGKVAVKSEGTGSPELGLEAGFGTVVEAGKAPLPPVALLPAPRMPDGALRFERTAASIKVSGVDGAKSYRALVAVDAAFKDVRADVQADKPEFVLPALPDGNYVLRVRAVDALGLEGQDAEKPFVLAAQPEPPEMKAPPPAARIAQPRVAFEWTPASGADRYTLQVARDEGFKEVVLSEERVMEPRYQPSRALGSGRYVWRLASVTAAGKQGPWSDPAAFVIQADLADPDVPQWVDGKLRFSWRGEAGLRYQVQIATDSKFRKVVLDQVADGPQLLMDRPAVGVYYMRYRMADSPAGSPFSTSQIVDVYPLGR